MLSIKDFIKNDLHDFGIKELDYYFDNQGLHFMDKELAESWFNHAISECWDFGINIYYRDKALGWF